jgi:SRSO17 transposase
MVIPIVEAAPIVVKYGEAFRPVFKDRRQFEHFRNYLTGLMVLDDKSLANIARCILESADKTNLSRFFSESPWQWEKVNEQRLASLLQETKGISRSSDESVLIVDDTLCEHVGNLFEYVDQHYNHGDGSYPTAHNLVTSHYLSGLVRFPVDFRLYRRYEEFTAWVTFVGKHFPGRQIPARKKERQQFHKEVDPVLLQDSEFAALDAEFKTKLDLASELLEQAIVHYLPFDVVLFDGWFLASEFVQAIEGHEKDWISILKKNRNLETNSFVLKDANGTVISLPTPHIKVEDLVPLVPANAYRHLQVKGKSYWCFARNLSIPGLGKVRIVISFANAQLTGTYVVLVTNRIDWSPEHILSTYLLRWPIETFYQDGKGLLGLDEYRMRSAEAIQKHWSLVFVAYSFLHLDCLQSSLDTKSDLPRKTIGEACRQQASALIQALILSVHRALSEGESIETVFHRLFAKQSLQFST